MVCLWREQGTASNRKIFEQRGRERKSDSPWAAKAWLEMNTYEPEIGSWRVDGGIS
jgi:hypothetical protein